MPKTDQTVWYGDIKEMPIGVMQERVAKAQEELAELEIELQRRKTFTSAMRLADRLHMLLHRGINCDYHYSDWGGVLTSCRGDFLRLAESLLTNYTLDVIHAFITPMERVIMGPSYAPEKEIV